MKILSYPIAELTGKVDGIAGDIKQKEAELSAAISANEVIAQMGSRNNAAARVVGRINLFLETLLPNEDFAKLEAENRRLNNKVRQLEEQIGADDSKPFALKARKPGFAGPMPCRSACAPSSPTGSWPCTAQPRRRHSQQP